MTDEATTARKMAIDCEMLKVAYRQSKDGIVVSFLIHPQQVPDGLAVAALGTRYIVALVEIGDDEMPKKGDKSAAKPKEVTPAAPRPDHDATPGVAHKLSQQAAILCGEPTFRKFLIDNHNTAFREASCDPAECVRLICGVKSRSEIKDGTVPGTIWRIIARDYRAWMREPEVIP